MKPLLQITTTPAKYEYEVSHARLEINQKGPTVNRTTKRATLNMQKQAGQWQMSSARRRSDMGLKGIADRASFESDRGRSAALEAAGNYVDFGNQMANIAKGGNIPDAMWAKTMKHSKGDLVLLPLSPVDIQYIPASLAVDFQPASVHSEWDIGKAQMEFIPGSFGLNMLQHPSISIQYLGGPIYAPPSADPNFEAMA